MVALWPADLELMAFGLALAVELLEAAGQFGAPLAEKLLVVAAAIAALVVWLWAWAE